MKINKQYIIYVIISLTLTTSIGLCASPVAAVPATPETSVLDTVRKATSNSIGILLMSAIGGVYSGILYKAADKQEKEAKENIDKIDKLIKTFKDSYINFCPTGRESLTEPKCYCYLETGKQNTNRTNSQTCKDLWAKDTYMITATATDYSANGQLVDPVGCINIQGKFDEKCNCKKFIDNKGGNACMKTTNINIPSGIGATFVSESGLKDVVSLANNSANGNSNLGSLNGDQLGKNAIKSRKLIQDMYKKIASKMPKNAANLLNVDEKNVGRLASAVFGNNAIQSAMNGSQSAVGMAGSRDTDAATASALKQAAANAGLVEVSGTGLGLTNKKNNDKGTNFNFLNDQTSANGSQVQNFPESTKNYNYKDNDISSNNDVSIFEIISNRYIQSGLKKLFEN